MKASISWIEEATFLPESGGGHTVSIDGLRFIGGHNIGI